MTRRQRWVLGWFAILTIPIAGYFLHTPQSGVLAQDNKVTPKADTPNEQGLRAAGKAYAEAMNAGNLDQIMSFWNEDADYINESGAVTRGREELTKLFKAGLEASKGHKYRMQVNSIKFLRPEVAIVDGSIEETMVDGGKVSTRYSVVWVKSGDKWLISSARDLPADLEAPSLAYPALQSLEWLVGEWETEENAAKNVSISCRWAPNKTFLLIDYSLPREGSDPLKVEQRIGWDPHNTMIRSWVFDSAGGFGEGYWERDGNTWIVAASGITPEGGTGGATNVWQYIDETHFQWSTLDRDVDGQPLPDVKVKFVRKAAKK